MIHTLADVTVTATPTALSATSVRAAWVQIQAISISAEIRIGDQNITTTRGSKLLSALDAQFFPALGVCNSYDLSTIYIVGTQNDTVSVLYDTF